MLDPVLSFTKVLEGKSHPKVGGNELQKMKQHVQSHIASTCRDRIQTQESTLLTMNLYFMLTSRAIH